MRLEYKGTNNKIIQSDRPSTTKNIYMYKNRRKIILTERMIISKKKITKRKLQRLKERERERKKERGKVLKLIGR